MSLLDFLTIVSEIFSFGASSKGDNRGVGLYTVMKLVESYPNISLNTTCQNQVFRQVLMMIYAEG